MEDPVLDFHVLDAVQKSDGKMTQRNVSERLGRSVSSVNFALRLLAAKGFIKISGVNPRNLRYHLTPKGVLQKSVLAYSFMKRQRALYDEVRNGLLKNLRTLSEDGVKTVSLYGWTPFTETAILSLVLDGIEVVSIYVERLEGLAGWNRIPFRLVDDFKDDCDVLVLMEPLPDGLEEKIAGRKLFCYPIF